MSQVLSMAFAFSIQERQFSLVVNHLYSQIISCESGITTCKSATVNGKSLSEQVSMLTETEIKEAARKRDSQIEDTSVDGVFLKRINISCKC